jgi:hypothetical protein
MSLGGVLAVFGVLLGLFVWTNYRAREQIAEIHRTNAADHKAWLRECDEARARGEDPPAPRPMRRPW